MNEIELIKAELDISTGIGKINEIRRSGPVRIDARDFSSLEITNSTFAGETTILGCPESIIWKNCIVDQSDILYESMETNSSFQQCSPPLNESPDFEPIEIGDNWKDEYFSFVRCKSISGSLMNFFFPDEESMNEHIDSDESGAQYIFDSGNKYYLHCADEPTIETKDEQEAWYREGCLHREDGPAITNKDGKAWFICGVKHREDGPAEVFLTGLEYYHLCGRGVSTELYKKLLHKYDFLVSGSGSSRNLAVFENKKSSLSCEELPASITNLGESWYKDGVLHRLDGPAMIGKSGYNAWYKDGLGHRDGGPAILNQKGLEIWMQNGKKHRLDGPAYISGQGDYKEFWLNGDQLKDSDDLIKHQIEYVKERIAESCKSVLGKTSELATDSAKLISDGFAKIKDIYRDIQMAAEGERLNEKEPVEINLKKDFSSYRLINDAEELPSLKEGERAFFIVRDGPTNVFTLADGKLVENVDVPQPQFDYKLDATTMEMPTYPPDFNTTDVSDKMFPLDTEIAIPKTIPISYSGADTTLASVVSNFGIGNGIMATSGMKTEFGTWGEAKATSGLNVGAYAGAASGIKINYDSKNHVITFDFPVKIVEPLKTIKVNFEVKPVETDEPDAEPEEDSESNWVMPGLAIAAAGILGILLGNKKQVDETNRKNQVIVEEQRENVKAAHNKSV